jgi:hypothetical protein
VHRTTLCSFALVLGLAAPALAKPPGFDNGRFDRMHVASDGRGDRDIERAGRPVEHEGSTTVRDAAHLGKLPIRSEIRIKLNDGDRREEDSRAVNVGVDHEKSRSGATAQIRTEIRLKTNDGDRREDSDSPKSWSRRDDKKDKKDKDGKKDGLAFTAGGKGRPLTEQERMDACRHLGVCLPGPASGDDEDKVE